MLPEDVTQSALLLQREKGVLDGDAVDTSQEVTKTLLFVPG